MIDLHTHSTVSDGSDPPERIPELAAAAGCTAVALTDHDRLDGIAAARARADEVGVELVPGCELSCEVGSGGTMHLLVYFVDEGSAPLAEELIRLQQARHDRNVRLVDRLSEAAAVRITLEEVEAEAGGGGVGRPHVAAVLVRRGVVSSIQEAFDVWLAKGRPGYVEKDRLEPAPAIDLARRSGGVPVLAHPLSLNLESAGLDQSVRELAQMGLDGIEAVYGRYDEEQRKGLAALASRHGLVVTGGSDHHGSYKPDLQVGVGRGDLCVPDDVLTRLSARRS